MSSIEHLSAPRTPSPPPPAGASEVNDDTHGQSTATVTSDFPEATSKVCQENFLTDHLRSPDESPNITDEMLATLQEIKGATSEQKMYGPAASLLTSISKTLYESLPDDIKVQHRERHGIPADKDAHLTFINHSTTAPTHFPNDAKVGKVADKPDLVGVYNLHAFDKCRGADGIYRRVPHYRIETIVEAKSLNRGGGRPQATSYAYRHLQARPDHPLVYCLIIKPQWYQVIVSDPTGVHASYEIDGWGDGLDLLVAYIYSHYCPPDDHFLWDETIAWVPGETLDKPPTWKVKFEGKWHDKGRFIFIGAPWGRRTMILRVRDSGSDGCTIIIKDTYRHYKRRFKEEDIINEIHKEGDILGVVRLKGAEHVMAGNETLKVAVTGDQSFRTKERFGLLDSGLDLLSAKSVNDLLMAVFDALEVHRTVLLEREVLHRDMSIYNILMYPEFAKVEGRPVSEKTPVSIQDVLNPNLWPPAERFPAALVIDFDNAAKLKDRPRNELTERTGTPMYIARSVSLGMVINTVHSFRGVPMPRLTDKALDRYITAFGRERYDRYNDTTGPHPTCHGGYPPTEDPEMMLTEDLPPFRHRAEHDVESVYWALVAGVLYGQPVEAVKEVYPPELNAMVWDILLGHHIPEGEFGQMSEYGQMSEKRDQILNQTLQQWLKLFNCDDMKDVARLMFQISKHVRSEYAMWTGDLPQDHLHEAIQRLILQYLVEHEQNPIELDPEHLRPTDRPPVGKPAVLTATQLTGSQGTGTHQSGTRGSGSGKGGSRGGLKRSARTVDNANVAGPSRQTRERATASGRGRTRTSGKGSNRRSNIKPAPPTHTSKRMKGPSGAPIPTQRDDEAAEDEELNKKDL